MKKKKKPVKTKGKIKMKSATEITPPPSEHKPSVEVAAPPLDPNFITIHDSQRGTLRMGSTNGIFFPFNPNPQPEKVSDARLRSSLLGEVGYECRESFSAYFHPDTKQVGFHRKAALVDYENVAEFFETIESTLGLDKKSVVNPTFDGHGVVIDVADWWLNDQFKRSFFTLMLRCACLYYKGDLEKAFQSYTLICQCRPAVNRFLDGYTKVKKGWSRGFVEDLSVVGFVEPNNQLEVWMVKP